jgi:hypothetical protein
MNCPKCKKEIDKLLNIQTGTACWDFSVDEEGNEDYIENDDFFVADAGEDRFECPECMVTLFYSEDEAIKFLKGKKVSK